MAIHFRLGDEAHEHVAFAYSPLLEAVFSLHVLVEPKHHPLQHPWVRRMRRLPPALKRSVAEFAFLYRHMYPDCFSPPAVGTLRTLEEELHWVCSLDRDTLALEFARPMYDHGGKRDPALLARPEARARIEAAAGRW